jgi:hypothetical protein
MKLDFVILAAAMTTGGLASVHVSGPATREPGSPILARGASPSPASMAATPPAAAQLKPAAERKPYLEALQAPVPLVMKARPPIEVPMSDVASTSAPQSRSDTSRSAATAFIEADGYKSVRILSKSKDGIWHAKALRGTTEVQVTVDAQGNVSAD